MLKCVVSKNASLRSIRPIKAWEDHDESFEALPRAASVDDFCKVTILYVGDLHMRSKEGKTRHERRLGIQGLPAA